MFTLTYIQVLRKLKFKNILSSKALNYQQTELFHSQFLKIYAGHMNWKNIFLWNSRYYENFLYYGTYINQIDSDEISTRFAQHLWDFNPNSKLKSLKCAKQRNKPLGILITK